MSDAARAMVLASFAADSLALGAHWIYSQKQIVERFGRVTQPEAPGPDSQHPTKKAGDFTHYGDQTLFLLEYLVRKKALDQKEFVIAWKGFMDGYQGYTDGATKATLSNLAAGADPESAGSESDDLAGASRMAPVIYLYRNDPAACVHACRHQTAATHNHPLVVECAAILARVVLEGLEGVSPVQALRRVADEEYISEDLVEGLVQGMDSAGRDTAAVIKEFGQFCEISGAWPSVVHLLARYENDLRQALEENVMAGGDSAGRGMIVGMVLGARLGMDSIPDSWLSGMNAFGGIKELLAALDGSG